TTTCALCRGSMSPDMLAHETAHLMARNMRQPASSISLGGTGESGALTESIGDFFGEAFERYLRGSNDWIIGGDHPIHLRNMADPPSQPQDVYQTPDRYLSPIYYTGGPIMAVF